MKFLLLTLAFINPLFLTAQKREPTSNDSIEIYQKKLNKLWRTNYDSLRSSENYKELVDNIKRLRGNSRNYGGVVIFGDITHSDYTKLNQSIVQSGFTPLKSNFGRIGFGVSNKSGKAITDFYLAVLGFNNQSKKNSEKIKTSLASILQLDYGYDLTKSGLVDIYPFLGLSLRLSSLNYLKPAEVNPNYTNISNILISNQTAYSSSFRLGFQAGLGIDFNLSSSKVNGASTLFFTKFGINRPLSADKYKVEGVTYKPEILQGVWVLAFGFKFVSPQ
jgi:hypothetical protein